MKIDIVIQEKHLALLSSGLFQPDGKEHAAYIFFGVSQIEKDPFSQESRQRLLSREVHMVNDNEISSTSHSHISWSTERFVSFLSRAEEESTIVGIAHSHLQGQEYFSAQDNKNEADLIKLVQNRNGSGSMLPSLLFASGCFVGARVWQSPNKFIDVEVARTTGNYWQIFQFNGANNGEREEFSRQELALGSEFNKKLSSLRFGVVGVGGTGSALVQQIVRMGIRNLAIFDPDHVEYSNLNRLYGASVSDAKSQMKKVSVMKREVDRMELGADVKTYDSYVGSAECRDALKSMDVIFGCTDDHEGRFLLNRLAYYYLIPVIDIGLAMCVSERKGTKFLNTEGRVTVLEPDADCLICRGTISATKAAEESLKRRNRQEYDRRKSESYILGEDIASPSVISFTTSVASMAIEEMIQRFVQFRGMGNSIANRIRKFSSTLDFRPEAKKNTCEVCNSTRNHGIGDTVPFLGRVG